MLDDLALFASIVESGSLSAAARRAQMPPATVTRRLQQLEQRLGCKLLHRSARRLRPTLEGQAYYERCAPLLQSLQQATQSLEASQTQVQGLVRVLAPMTLAKHLLMSVWEQYVRLYPQVQLELRLSNLREDMLEHGADLAVRLGVLPDSNMVQRRLGVVKLGLFAAPRYLAQAPAISSPQDLPAHRWLVADPLRELQLTHTTSGERYTLALQSMASRCVVNDVELAAQWAHQGQGLLYGPAWLCEDWLRSGELVPVLPDWSAPVSPLSLIWPQQRHVPARVRALIDLLDTFARTSPALQGDALGSSIIAHHE